MPGQVIVTLMMGTLNLATVSRPQKPALRNDSRFKSQLCAETFNTNTLRGGSRLQHLAVVVFKSQVYVAIVTHKSLLSVAIVAANAQPCMAIVDANAQPCMTIVDANAQPCVAIVASNGGSTWR
ncbi:hypothetical protein BaRGS_00005779 [Batillaria attramentaria]|uniref:Uncharacterized protein n=1 Tax=Batillaria attramentaria TaxID=370345 RepID=A0ABD0LUU2_9CAEN